MQPGQRGVGQEGHRELALMPQDGGRGGQRGTVLVQRPQGADDGAAVQAEQGMEAADRDRTLQLSALSLPSGALSPSG